MIERQIKRFPNWFLVELYFIFSAGFLSCYESVYQESLYSHPWVSSQIKKITNAQLAVIRRPPKRMSAIENKGSSDRSGLLLLFFFFVTIISTFLVQPWLPSYRLAYQ